MTLKMTLRMTQRFRVWESSSGKNREPLNTRSFTLQKPPKPGLVWTPMNPQEDLGVGDTWILFPRSENRCIRLLPPQEKTVFNGSLHEAIHLSQSYISWIRSIVEFKRFQKRPEDQAFRIC